MLASCVYFSWRCLCTRLAVIVISAINSAVLTFRKSLSVLPTSRVLLFSVLLFFCFIVSWSLFYHVLLFSSLVFAFLSSCSVCLLFLLFCFLFSRFVFFSPVLLCSVLVFLSFLFPRSSLFYSRFLSFPIVMFVFCSHDLLFPILMF